MTALLLATFAAVVGVLVQTAQDTTVAANCMAGSQARSPLAGTSVHGATLDAEEAAILCSVVRADYGHALPGVGRRLGTTTRLASSTESMWIRHRAGDRLQDGISGDFIEVPAAAFARGLAANVTSVSLEALIVLLGGQRGGARPDVWLSRPGISDDGLTAVVAIEHSVGGYDVILRRADAEWLLVAARPGWLR